MSVALLLGLLGLLAPAAEAGTVTDEEGKKLFLSSKCQGCHAIEARGIGIDEKAAAGSEDGEEAGDAAVKPPDLSTVGDRREAKFLHDYLKKQIAIEGRKHKRRFPGTKEERERLVDWLISLKSSKK